VFAQHGEAEPLHGGDVVDHRLVGRGRVEAVGPVALVQDPGVEVRPAVQQQPGHAVRAGAHPEGAHPEISGDAILAERDRHVVEERILRGPRPYFGKTARAQPCPPPRPRWRRRRRRRRSRPEPCLPRRAPSPRRPTRPGPG
jgi:hypothetical protein